jgi:hypothetical protein
MVFAWCEGGGKIATQNKIKCVLGKGIINKFKKIINQTL